MMNPLDHERFHALEIDAIFDELDPDAASAVDAHAASCAACAARIARLRRTRKRGLSVLAEAVPQDFEARIMAAVDEALARRAPATPHRTAAGTVIPFLARPSFAVAATLVLVLGAAAILSQVGLRKASSPLAMDESALSAPAASMAATAPERIPAAAAASAANVAGASSDPKRAEVVAREEPPAAGAQPAPATPTAFAAAPSPPSARGRIASAGDAPTKIGSAGSLDSAKALFKAGRCQEAMPTLDALRGSSPEADLYAARCVLQLRGCAAATAQLEAVAQQYPGSATGTRARNEAAACNRALSETDRPAATTGPGTPAAAKPSSPRAVPAEPARQ